MKRCPYCAEEIQDDAVKCRFCGEFLKKKARWWKNCLMGCLVSFLAMVLMAILFIFLSYLALKFIIYKVFFAGPYLPHYNLALPGAGLDDTLRGLGQILSQLWEGLKNFFHSGPHNYQGITF